MKNLAKASLGLIMAGVMMSLLPVSCGSSGKTTNKPFMVEHQNCPMKHIVIEYLDEFDATINIDYPVNAQEKLTDSITAFINETLYSYFEYDDYENQIHIPYQNVYSTDLPHIAKHYWDAYRSFYDQLDPIYHWLDMNIVAQTDTYVTYEVVLSFRGEGIHEFRQWTTFVKKDGHRLKEMISNENLLRFYEDYPELVRNGSPYELQRAISEGYDPCVLGLLCDSLACVFPDNTGHEEIDLYDLKTIKPYLSKEVQKLVSGNGKIK